MNAKIGIGAWILVAGLGVVNASDELKSAISGFNVLAGNAELPYPCARAGFFESICDMPKRIKQLEEDNHSYQIYINDADEKIRKLETEYAALTSVNKNLQEELVSKKEEIRKLQNDYDLLKNELDKICNLYLSQRNILLRGLENGQVPESMVIPGPSEFIIPRSSCPVSAAAPRHVSEDRCVPGDRCAPAPLSPGFPQEVNQSVQTDPYPDQGEAFKMAVETLKKTVDVLSLLAQGK